MDGKALALALLMLTASLASVAGLGFSGGDEPHAPIEIVGDQALAANTCSCVANPNAAGTQADPYIIDGWRIENRYGPAIAIRDVGDLHVLIRDNTLEAETGIELVNTGDRASIVRNVVTYDEVGIELETSGAYVADNKIEEAGDDEDTVAIRIDGASPKLEGNEIRGGATGVRASSASPVILDNLFRSNDDAIVLTHATKGTVQDNVVNLADRWGVVVERSADVDLHGNDINEGAGGVIVQDATLYMAGNEISNQKADAVRFENAVVTMLRNDVSDNWRGAFGSRDSHLLMVDNTFEHNQEAAIRVVRSEGAIRGNTVLDNGAGIRLDSSIITLENNVVNNNTLGLSIPYNSKGSIPLMQGNIVNGLNVDGTIRPGEQRIFYRAFGLNINDTHFDSNQDEGYFGTTMAQGPLVVYDSVNVTIEDNRFTWQHRGATVVNGTVVRVQANVFENIEAEAVLSVDSRTFFKENECDIEIDPPDPTCFAAEGGRAVVRANLIANLAVGVRFSLHAGQATTGIVAGNTIENTSRVAVHLEGNSRQTVHDVQVRNNAIVDGNLVGMELVSFHGRVEANLVQDSDVAAIHLDERSNATFVGNRIVANGEGIVDLGFCGYGWSSSCSGGVFVDNEVRGNAGVGVHLKHPASFQGDVVADNEIGLRLDGGGQLHNVDVDGNARAGVIANARLDLNGVNVTANGGVGLQADGRVSATLLNATRNDGAGIQVQGPLTGGRLNASHNGGVGIQVQGPFTGDTLNASHNGGVGIDVQGSFTAEDTNASDNEDDGIHVQGSAFLYGVTALSNEEDGIHVRGAAEIEHANTSGNRRAGMHFTGTLFVVSDCETSFNEDGVVAATGVDVQVNGEIEIPMPSLPDDVPPQQEDQDPLWMHQCNVVGNSEFALEATSETLVNATQNYWGPEGPRYDVPLFETGNVISNHVVLIAPYWQTRAHDTSGCVPHTEAGATQSVPSNCRPT